ncbi:hypothetical protein AFLA_004611 [Aspergillus flavus NRRL3357]|nr:hypothetical protein AFLA_004611 [Aspergillus flavus NRRL3357]
MVGGQHISDKVQGTWRIPTVVAREVIRASRNRQQALAKIFIIGKRPLLPLGEPLSYVSSAIPFLKATS